MLFKYLFKYFLFFLGKAALESFYKLRERPFTIGLAATVVAFLQPTFLVGAISYVILGGVIGGAAVATPVFVVGTTGVFVSAAVYHSWIAVKRAVTAKPCYA